MNNYSYTVKARTLCASSPNAFKTDNLQKAIDVWSRAMVEKPHTGTMICVKKNNTDNWMLCYDQGDIHRLADIVRAESEESKKPNRVERAIMEYNREEVQKRYGEELKEYLRTDETKFLEEALDFHGKFEEMSAAEQDAIINPKHYKMIPKEAYERFPDGLEYMDLMEYILRGHSGVNSHLLGQVFKYACRLGKKDSDLQDATKISWYANRLVEVLKNKG